MKDRSQVRHFYIEAELSVHGVPVHCR